MFASFEGALSQTFKAVDGKADKFFRKIRDGGGVKSIDQGTITLQNGVMNKYGHRLREWKYFFSASLEKALATVRTDDPLPSRRVQFMDVTHGKDIPRTEMKRKAIIKFVEDTREYTIKGSPKRVNSKQCR